MIETAAPGRRVHRIADDEEPKPRGKGRRGPPVERQAFEDLLEEYRRLVNEFMTCCMSSERYLLARVVIERGEDRLRAE